MRDAVLNDNFNVCDNMEVNKELCRLANLGTYMLGRISKMKKGVSFIEKIVSSAAITFVQCGILYLAFAETAGCSTELWRAIAVFMRVVNYTVLSFSIEKRC